jgi:hypothetical protein
MSPPADRRDRRLAIDIIMVKCSTTNVRALPAAGGSCQHRGGHVGDWLDRWWNFAACLDHHRPGTSIYSGAPPYSTGKSGSMGFYRLRSDNWDSGIGWTVDTPELERGWPTAKRELPQKGSKTAKSGLYLSLLRLFAA